jgi:homoserine O-acetyltransferase/O-succinyltransferase
MSADFGTVEDRGFIISNFRLQNGAVMPQAKIAYETYGRLAPDGRNAVLITHGYTSSHHAAGRNPANGNLPGWWDGLIGSGKAVDTDRSLSSPRTCWARPLARATVSASTHGPASPTDSTFRRSPCATSSRALLGALGVKHLVAVAGPSYVGYQAFQWAVAYPDFMDAIVPGVTAPKAQNVEQSRAQLVARLATDPEWNGGHYYDGGGAKTTLTELRVEMLKRNGIEVARASRYLDRESR